MENVAKIFSASLNGIEAELIEVEADLNIGLHSFNIVGLADKAINEAKERINSALKNSNIKPPQKENKRITINLAPADIKKVGSQFDLPIALAYLIASNQIKKFEAQDKIFVGELSLNGDLRPINGALNYARLAQKQNFKYLFLPEKNALEASLIKEIKIIPLKNLKQLIEILENNNFNFFKKENKIEGKKTPSNISLDDVKGQEIVKRALLVAAAGSHNILMTGSPGTGKTMLAQAFCSILPPPNEEEIIEITEIYSAAGLTFKEPIINYRPFRSPHHSASLTAIIGGGQIPKPGEISLAHRGVLFLDELPEFHKDVLESLRQPLENGFVHVARAKKSLIFPAKFIFIGAMNPCPCGFFNDPQKECICSAYQILKYQKKISGPLLDRIDLQINVARINLNELKEKPSQKLEEKYNNLIKKAREIQKQRFKNLKLKNKIYTNSEMTSKMVDALVKLDEKAEELLKKILEKEFISGRGYYRILKIAQTIADLEESEIIKSHHLAEAFQYRLKTNENYAS